MKKVFLCLLIPFLQLFSNTEKPEKIPKIEESWTWDQSYLFLNIALDDELRFGETYDTFKLKSGNLGAEIHFLPSENVDFVKNDSLLQDIVFTVHLSYDQDKHLVNYEIFKKFIYDSPGYFFSNKTTSTTTTTGHISNIDIDLSEKAQFFIDEKFANEGFFLFKIQ